MTIIMYLTDNELQECVRELSQDASRIPSAEDRELLSVVASRIGELHSEILDLQEL